MHLNKGIIVILLLLLNANITHAKDSLEISGEYLVKIKNSVDAKLFLSDLSKGGSLSEIVSESSNTILVKRSVLEVKSYAIKSLKNHANVEYVEPNIKISIKNTPDDPDFFELWGLVNEQKNGTRGADIMAQEAWGITTGSKNIVIAVIDTGVDYTHPDLRENMWINEVEKNGLPNVDDVYGYNFADPMDDQGHGSHCSGTIGAKGNDGFGIAGVNWNVSIMALKFLSKSGSGTLAGAISSIDYAIDNGAQVLSNSWGAYLTLKL